MLKSKNGKGVCFRILSMVLLIVILGSVFAGCGGNKTAEEKTNDQVASSTASGDTTAAKPDSWISDEPLEFSLLYSDNAVFPFNADWLVMKEIEKRTNVKLKVNAVPQSDYNDKMKLLLSSGEIPNFIACADGIDSQFMLNGVVLPVSDYMDKLPHFKAAIEKGKVQQEIENITQADGKFYYMPGIRVIIPAYDGLATRTDLLKNYGMEKPTNVDELYSYLKKYKDANPKSLPLTVQNGFDCMLFFFAPVYGVQAGWSADNGTFFDWETNQYSFVYTNDRYKEMLKYLAKLYKEGLLDPESFTQSSDQWKTKLATGVSVASYMWNGQDGEIMAIGQKSNPELNFEMSSPLSALPGIKGTTEPYSQLKNGWAMPATAANDPNFDKMLKFMDWLVNSEESTVLGHWGIEGETYTINANGQKEWTDVVKNAPGGAGAITQPKYGLCNNSLNPSTPEDYELSISLPYMAEVTKKNRDNDLFGKVPPKAKFTVDEMENVKLIIAPLKDYCEKMQQQFIFGTKSLDTDWDTFVKEVEKKDVKKLMEMYNSKLK